MVCVGVWCVVYVCVSEGVCVCVCGVCVCASEGVCVCCVFVCVGGCV